MKIIDKDKLIISPSMILPFNGNYIFYSSLDGLNVYNDIAIDKFLVDIKTIKRPSSPSLIAINLYGTIPDNDLIVTIINHLIKSGVSVRKVVFVSINAKGKKLVKSALKNQKPTFICSFNDDYEKAKLWLVS